MTDLVNENIFSNQLLYYFINNSNMNVDDIRNNIEIMRKKEYLSKHMFKVWQGKDERWYTRIPDETKEYGNRLVKRTTKEAIEELIIEYYKSKENKPQLEFSQRWNIWMERQKKCGVSDNTINRYKSDYRRFIENDIIEHMKICNITDDNLREFFVRVLASHNISYKALKTLYGYVNGVFEKSVKEKVIYENPCKYIDLPEFIKLCNMPKKYKANERILSDEEIIKLKNKIQDDYVKKPYYIAPYAVEFAIYTGMRVGEIAALKWENISFKDKVITIDSSEKYNRETKEYLIDKPKNGKSRYFPLTPQIEEFLIRLKKTELKYNYINDFVFANANGRIHAKTISSCAQNKTEQAGIGCKSIHALRRTLNSKLKCMGVATPVAASLLGHTEDVNENNYTYDVTNLAYKNKIITEILNIS